MRSLRYLNTMLTILAVLLALQLWTTWTGTPAADSVSVAHAEARGGGIPDEGAQRKEMIDLLKRLTQQMDELKGTLTSGEVRVKLENAPGK
ncbi:MAG: hypothetical protein K8S99_10655 [Planctomycetes bacterium]|nr:hypothetical protein [Planctomycetota bacterium]